MQDEQLSRKYNGVFAVLQDPQRVRVGAPASILARIPVPGQDKNVIEVRMPDCPQMLVLCSCLLDNLMICSVSPVKEPSQEQVYYTKIQLLCQLGECLLVSGP